MKILHIETSSKNCSVAISFDEKLLCLCEKVSQDYKQSENLHTYIEWALEGAEIKLKDLDAVSLGKGPGSYTGLRIGAASAKGFCFGLGIPLVTVNSLETMVEPFLGNYDLIIPLIDARRMEVFTAVYSHDFSPILGERAEILTESTFDTYLNKGKTIFLGDGITKFQAICKHKNAYFWENKFPSAKQMGRLALEKYQAQAFEDIAYFEPFYLKEVYLVKSNK